MSYQQVNECVKHKASSLKHKEEKYYIDAASRNTFKLPFLFVVSVQVVRRSMEGLRSGALHPQPSPALSNVGRFLPALLGARSSAGAVCGAGR